MTMTFYVLSVQYVSYSLSSKTVHYIDTMTEKMFGFSIFIDCSSLEAYKFKFFCRILQMPSPPIFSVNFLLCFTFSPPFFISSDPAIWIFTLHDLVMLFLMLEMPFKLFFDDKLYIQFIYPKLISTTNASASVRSFLIPSGRVCQSFNIHPESCTCIYIMILNLCACVLALTEFYTPILAFLVLSTKETLNKCLPNRLILSF